MGWSPVSKIIKSQNSGRKIYTCYYNFPNQQIIRASVPDVLITFTHFKLGNCDYVNIKDSSTGTYYLKEQRGRTIPKPMRIRSKTIIVEHKRKDCCYSHGFSLQWQENLKSNHVDYCK